MTLRALTVRGIPEVVLKALRTAAKRNRRSLNAEVLVRLEEGSVAALARETRAGVTGATPRLVLERSLVGGPPGTAAAAARVAEPAGQLYEVRRAFEQERVALLESDLRMTPEQRALMADRLLDDALAARPRPNVHTVRAFDSWEDYLAWKRTDFLL